MQPRAVMDYGPATDSRRGWLEMLMNKVKALLTAAIVTTGSAFSAAAADMPVESTYAPLHLRAAPIDHARLVCNDFGRCVRVGPPPVFYGPPEFYPRRPRVYAAPVYEEREYEVRPSYRDRRYDAPDYEYRRSEEVRRSFGEPKFAAPADEDRRPRAYGSSERGAPREDWSREDRSFEHGDERD